MENKLTMDEQLEQTIMTLICNGGDARCNALEAIKEARKGNFEEADSLLKRCDETLAVAHEAQTEMIKNEINGKPTPQGLLMIHAQDHLMNALTVKDLAEQIVALCKEVVK